MKKTFNSHQLQLISHCAGILRACKDIPFELANKVNSCKIMADAALKLIQDQIALVEERKTADTLAQSQKDLEDILKQKHELEFVGLMESEFISHAISGDKEVVQHDGSIKKFSYRDAYFNLLNLVIFP